jgi:hypothetical protein
MAQRTGKEEWLPAKRPCLLGRKGSKKEGAMKRISKIYWAKRMLVATVLALCAIVLAFPVTTVWAMGTELGVVLQDGDGYGTAWFVDPGEWYVAPAAPVAQASKVQPADDGYGTAWFIDPGEWYVPPESPVFLVTRPKPDEDGYGSAWFADPGEWYAERDGALALANQAESGSD